MSATAKPVVVLFDIDETLVHTGGSGARSWKVAFDTLYGIPADIGQHTSAGETDPEVARATFTGVLGRDASDDELNRIYALYLRNLAEDIMVSEGYRTLPGADRCLEGLGEAGVLLGLVSGAMEGAARTKLIPANLNRYFLFGAYGSDSPDRAEITGLAIQKAGRLHAHLTPAEVFVVGDTPRDIDAARKAGAVSVGVASGKYSVAELSEAGADHVLGSLTEPFPGMEGADGSAGSAQASRE
jgi:phosphoglycolate phosphatase-like HAD superfamily hydrolase